MLAASGPHWFDRRRPENSWPSIVISVGITSALFVSAFLAMQTVGRLSSRVSEPPEPTVVVRLTPPPRPIKRPRPAPAPMTPKPVVAPSTTIPAPPSAVPTTIAPMAGGAPTIAPTAAPTARDTAGGGEKGAPSIPLGPLPLNRLDTAVGSPTSAAAREAGVTIGSRVRNTAAYRDSMLKEKLGVPYLAAKYAPKGEILAALRQSQATALRTYRRSTTAGNADVHVAQGEGMNGEGAVGGGAGVQGGGMHLGSSFGLPLLSKGPSAEQRKKNEVIDLDYRDRLHRLEDRLLLKRDSIHLDSLRRDSLARRRP